MKSIAILLITLLLMSSCENHKAPLNKKHMKNTKYQTGQISKYKTRAAEEESTLIILTVEEYKHETVIHIALDSLKIKNFQVENGISRKLPHLPMSVESLDSSVVELVSKENKTEIPEGYYLWKEEFDKGKAGVFTLTVKEVVDYIENSISK